jgi:glutaredoxin
MVHVKKYDILNKRVEEINLGKDPDRIDELVEKTSGKTSVPQIFLEETYIGVIQK